MSEVLLVDSVLLFLVTVCAVAIVEVRSLYAVAMLSSVYSLLMALVWTNMHAMDVAFTEAAVGGGISTILLIGTLVHTRRDAETRQRQDRKSEFDTDTRATAMVRKMEQNLDFPLSLAELAETLKTSKRTLARVSEDTFQVSPMRLYLRIRLQAARNYLFYEEHTINDVATALADPDCPRQRRKRRNPAR